jgi:hypothetical protein
MQLNVKPNGTFTPLLFSIQLNIKPYVRMRHWNILYNINKFKLRPFWTV